MNSRLRFATVPLAGLIFVSAAFAASTSPPASDKAPATWRDSTVTSYYGVKVADPYRWLEFSDSIGVKSWIAAQNAHTDRVLSGFSQSAAMARRVEQLALTSTRRSNPELAAGMLFYMQQTPPQQQAVLVAEKWPNGKPYVLVDPNKSGVAITGYWPSPDGKHIAYGTAEGGSEATTIHVVDIANGKILSDSLPHAGGGTSPAGVLWDADGKGFFYVSLPGSGKQSQFNAVLYHHTLGEAADSDVLAFGKGFSPVAEYAFASSSDGKNTAILVHYGDGNPDYVYLRTARGWLQVLNPKANVRAASGVSAGAVWQGGRLAVISYQDAPRGKLLAVTASGAQVLVPQDSSWAMHAVAAIEGGFLVTEVAGPDWRVVHYDARGKFVRVVPLPKSGIGVGAIASSERSDVALISYSGWTIPEHWARYDASKGGLKTVFAVKPAADYSKLRTVRLTATSKDGTKIPVTVVAMDGVKPDDKRPTILYAYGGYGIVIKPHFMGSYLAWLESGGVYALANIRGGGAYGEAWHEDGMLGKKQNDFDDFYAAAQELVKSGWTDSAHLGIQGGSNGGLLMGAALTQHPGEYRAVVSSVGIYDMLRSELWPNGRYNVSEYGTVTKKKEFQWLYAYSPLQHVKKGTAYPAVLLITGVNDPRVAPWQSRKFAAALQAANTSDRPILLLTRMNEGHGVTASFAQRVGNTAAALGFFAHELGLAIK
ncbi:MAG: prolyl oligopeptidase family serine peptidase [Gammaproteobacteria bacterium]